ncbi:hypothetical protein CSQ85_12645, partial [Bifidobacterium rousetti]|uniref:InlB B-repeat-containing protein n=1 Tax=Bifidobacterium rousetti TaxID=2045439 RepID=UPI001239F536
MTGNTKVWRAPLAGLASVAMLATMGVAAGTASAATGASRVDDYNVTVTLHANSPANATAKVDSTKDDLVAGATATFKLTDLDSNENGVLDELYTTTGVWSVTAPTDTLFTGWYTGADYGSAKFDFKHTLVDKNIDLYAHWAAPDDVVNFTFKTNSLFSTSSDAYGSGVATALKPFFSFTGGDYKLSVAKQDGKIAAWELPTDKANDHKVVTSWKADPTGSASPSPTYEVTNDELTADFSKALSYANSGPYDVELQPGTVKDATTVHYKKADNTNFTSPTDVDVAFGEKIPTDVLVYDGATHAYGYVSQWYYINTTGGAKTELPADYRANGNHTDLTLWSGATADAFAVSYWTAVGYEADPAGGYRQHFVKVATEYVESGKTATKAPALSRTDDTLSGWSTSKDFGAKQFDFSTPIYANTDLYAQWNTNNAGVTYNYNYSGKSEKQSYATGQEFTAPAPTRSGRVFLGWYFVGNVKTDGTIELANSQNPFISNNTASGTQGSEFYKSWNNTTDKQVGWNNDRGTDYVGKGTWLEAVPASKGVNASNQVFSDNIGTKTAVEIPAGAKLRINAAGNLEFLATKKT